MKVFLGGTVNGSTWRDKLIPQLDIDYFNPVVEEWDDEAYQRELYERQHCDFCLYIITPKMTGYYALAEVIDDSYKRPDRTLYCFLEKDEDRAFSTEEIESLHTLGEQVKENGGNWLPSIDSVTEFLNSGKALHIARQDETQEFDDVFISYGRRHSKAFATKLHDTLVKEHYAVWFDQNDIPLGVDFQEQINEGIARAHNFVFIISPHSIRSEFCLKEIEMAVKLNKRIIPLLHVEPTEELDNIHPAIAKINWIYIREEADENKELYEWKQVDDFDVSFQGLLQSIGNHASYVEMHTRLLVKALNWEKNQKAGKYLLVGKDRQDAEKWLSHEFLKGQPPCIPTDLHCEYICESKKNGENLTTEAFIAYAVENKAFRDSISKSLSRFGITTWVHTKDIKTGQNYAKAIYEGISQADNFILFISKASINSEYCQKELAIALSFNKRIIPVLTEALDENELPEAIRLLQYIDFVKETTNPNQHNIGFKEKVSKLIAEIGKDKGYYQKHKRYLTQALKWDEQNRNDSLLLRGYNLQDAEVWLEIGKKREAHQPTRLHDIFITASGTKRLQLSNEVFISYSRADSDFARKLNEALQLQGKTTWFDQESITSGVDFQEEIYRGIEASDNFLFIISPEAIRSPYCADEVEYAANLNKRFITIMHRQTDYLHPSLASVQWCDFEKVDFTEAFNNLITVLDLDRDYVQQHTKWSQRALAWEEQGQNSGLFLSGLELETASGWLKETKKAKKKPVPTTLLINFIANSETANKKEKRRKLLLAAMVVVMAGLFLISGALAYLANRERKQAIQAERLARSEKHVADSLRITAQDDKKLADSLRLIAEYEQHAADSLRVVAEKNGQQLSLALKEAQIAQQQAKAEANRARKLASEARKQSELARASEKRANELAEIAKQKAEEAKQLQLLAESRLQQYEEQKTIAEEAQVAYQEQKTTVDKIKMLAAASQLAVASQNQFNNGNVKEAKILGLHAFFLNEQYSEKPKDDFLIDRGPMLKKDSVKLLNRKVSEKAGNVPEIYDALSTVFFFENQDISIGSKSTVNTFAFSQQRASVRQFTRWQPATLAAGDEAGSIFIYKVDSKNKPTLQNTYHLKSPINQLKFNKDASSILTGTESGAVYLLRAFEAQKSPKPELICNLGDPVNFIDFIEIPNYNEKVIVTTSKSKIALWTINDIPTKSKFASVKVYETKSNNINAMAISPVLDKNALLAIGAEDRVEIYQIQLSKKGSPELYPYLNISPNSKVRQYTAMSVSSLAFSSNGSRLASGYQNGNIETWETKSFKLADSHFGHTGAVNQLSFENGKNRLISSSEDQTVRIWEKDNIENQLVLKNESSINALALTSNFSYLLTLRSGNLLRFWPTDTALLSTKLCRTIDENALSQGTLPMPMEKVYEYAGLVFTYENSNCVYYR
ncbi:MAG: TIR domain-containing protein [Bacteroidota bacterium]